MTLTSSSKTDKLLELYQRDVDSKIGTVPEIMRLKEKWRKQDIATLLNAIDALEACNADLFGGVRRGASVRAAPPPHRKTLNVIFSNKVS